MIKLVGQMLIYASLHLTLVQFFTELSPGRFSYRSDSKANSMCFHFSIAFQKNDEKFIVFLA